MPTNYPSTAIIGSCRVVLKSILAVYVWQWLLVGNCPAQKDQIGWESYLASRVAQLAQQTDDELTSVSAESWPNVSAQWREQLQDMLGLSPWPEKTDLQTTVTGSIQLAQVTVDRLHFQSRPGLYVTANLYRPVGDPPQSGWPAVLYVCGHARVADNGRLMGNKTSYQHHGIWFARHGVACLMIDTVQLGELHGEHHGTYKLGRWDWMSRGYTPAGVEAWNAIRGVDLLSKLPDIDAARIGITGRSGGGAYSWFAAALDERIQVAVPVAGITDLVNHVNDGCVEGHCDCMYFVNYYAWDYDKLAALVAPRALLIANSDNDSIFPLDGVMRIHTSISDLYQRLGVSDRLGLLVTPGPHQDTPELQVGAFKWLLKRLIGKEPTMDMPALKEIDATRLAVFEAETPKNETVTSLGSWFVPTEDSPLDPTAASDHWQMNWLPNLQRRGILSAAPQQSFKTTQSGKLSDDGVWKLAECQMSTGTLRILSIRTPAGQAARVRLLDIGDEQTLDAVLKQLKDTSSFSFGDRAHENIYLVQWTGAGWMQNQSGKRQHQIARRFYLVGETLESLMLRDVLSAMHWISQVETTPMTLSARGRSAGIAAMVGLLLSEPKTALNRSKVTALELTNFPLDADVAPSWLGYLRGGSLASLLAAASAKMSVTTHVDDQTNPYLVDTSSEPQQANGLRIVEVDQHSAQVWIRATRWPLANLGDLPEVKFEEPAKGNGKQNVAPILPQLGTDGLRFAVPGVEAEVRLGWSTSGSGWQYSKWQLVDHATDFSAIIPITELPAGSHIQIRTQVRAPGRETVHSLSGSFETLPEVESHANFKLAVATCQDFNDRDGPHGFDLYRTISQRETQAFVMAGDVVYYDALARSTDLAYYHWQRTYSLPTVFEFHRHMSSYFLKDDHDTYVNDSWPGTRFPWTGEFTFEEGQRIFKLETGLPEKGYRTFRIGADLQIWLMEGRDFRSPNNAPDGPDKSIWGSAQKAWCLESLASSSATFRVLISPTPLVGPDRENKRDNHSNRVFETEGRELRSFLAAQPNTITVCGDRHWQFHSVDPETGLHEFSVGPASDRHAGGWPANDFRPEIHKFLRVGGGYLEIELKQSSQGPQLILRHLDTHGQEQHRHEMQAAR
ncbi:MAG: alkaline phosphatase D family protein [Planctomycetales bacterium]|nr:alkaline phosphatase D family protein [Planctomycetales bacterium]